MCEKSPSSRNSSGLFATEGNDLVDQGDGLFTLDGSMRYNFVAPHVARFPVRMAAIRLRGGGLLVWSPFSPTCRVMEQIEALGEPVKFVVAPNSLHWLGAVEFALACNESQEKEGGTSVALCVAPGLPHKREFRRHMETLQFNCDDVYVLPEQLPPQWPANDEVAIFHIPGIPLIEEAALLHRPSRTLLAAELAFNFQRGHDALDCSWPMTWYLNFVDGYRPCCLTRTFRFLVEDAEAAITCLESILQRERDNIHRFVPAHGKIITEHVIESLRTGTLDLLYEIQRGPKKNDTSSATMNAVVIAVAALVVVAAVQCLRLNGKSGRST